VRPGGRKAGAGYAGGNAEAVKKVTSAGKMNYMFVRQPLSQPLGLVILPAFEVLF
jgi:hypothetical protein